RVGQPILIDLQPYTQRRTGCEARTDTAQSLTFDCVVKPERVAPEGFIPKRIESKDTAAIRHGVQRVAVDGVIDAGSIRLRIALSRSSDRCGTADPQHHADPAAQH